MSHHHHTTQKGKTAMNATMMKKLVVSVLALGVASSAIVFGSMAAWTATTSNNGNSVSTGTLTLSNSKPSAAAVLTATNIKPGDTGSDVVTIGNTGNVPLNLSLTQASVVQGAGADLKLRIFDGTKCVYPAGPGACTTWGAFDGSATLNNLANGSILAGANKTFTVSYLLETTSPNADQGKTNTFNLKFDGVPA